MCGDVSGADAFAEIWASRPTMSGVRRRRPGSSARQQRSGSQSSMEAAKADGVDPLNRQRALPARAEGTNTSGTGQDALSVMAESIWSEFIRRCYAGEGYSTNDHRSELDVTRMNRLHVTQDDAGYWMLSLEEEDGSLKLLA